jgi:hypothetical protein
MRRFAGVSEAYGIYKAAKTVRPGEKRQGEARTLRKPVTEELWDFHLEGRSGLGIIPIMKGDKCVWGCIDIDQYAFNHKEFLQKIADRPFVVCRSKSGGAHVFLFVEEPVPAQDMQDILKAWAAYFGYGDCEIFPKQLHIDPEKGNIGNWLNMPYFNGTLTDRYCVRLGDDGTLIKIQAPEDFLAYAKIQTQAIEKFGTFEPPIFEDELGDGPPCLQHLMRTGVAKGARNNGLFNFAVYCRKKFGEQEWIERTLDYNQRLLNPPLRKGEVNTLLESLAKRETYSYKCSDVPIVNYCNGSLCQRRKYGVGTSNVAVMVGGISKIECDPPKFFVDLEGKGRVELSTEELASYNRFSVSCLGQLNCSLGHITQKAWNEMLKERMEELTVIELPRDQLDDMSSFATTLNLIKDWISWFNEEDPHVIDFAPVRRGEDVYFRLDPVLDYLKKRHVRPERHKIVDLIKAKLGAEPSNGTLTSGNLICYKIPGYFSEISGSKEEAF